MQVTNDWIGRTDQGSLAEVGERRSERVAELERVARRERAARRALRAQIAKLERELAAVLADGFPHIALSPTQPSKPSGTASAVAPCLLDLERLERTRDGLVADLQAARRTTCERAEHERRSRELLRRMKLEPGRYKFVRLPVRDLGERGCGVWEVRPRLGLIGMLAGWWQVKLSSGCPLAKGHAAAWPGCRPNSPAAPGSHTPSRG